MDLGIRLSFLYLKSKINPLNSLEHDRISKSLLSPILTLSFPSRRAMSGRTGLIKGNRVAVDDGQRFNLILVLLILMINLFKANEIGWEL